MTTAKKVCPVMSFRQPCAEVLYCLEDECQFWQLPCKFSDNPDRCAECVYHPGPDEPEECPGKTGYCKTTANSFSL